ncbi:MAG TPA: hypothetical protein PLM37_11535, partial [Elusimicrobiota bacterium]|nr:hypothetical protein [Elusimicrobiota bacterium]
MSSYSMSMIKSAPWIFTIFLLPLCSAVSRAEAATIQVNFDDRVLSGSTGFGSNLDVNDNRHPEKHL